MSKKNKNKVKRPANKYEKFSKVKEVEKNKMVIFKNG